MPTSDVKSVYRTSDGQMVAHRARVKSIVVATSATAGTVVLKDGGTGGTARITIPTGAAAGVAEVHIPEGGVLFKTDVYLDLTDVVGVTVFYA